MNNKFSILLAAVAVSASAFSQPQTGDPKLTEVWTPVPKIVTPGNTNSDAPSDAIILFDGKNLDQWVDSRDTTAKAKWIVADNIVTVNKSVGDIQTKRNFKSTSK